MGSVSSCCSGSDVNLESEIRESKMEKEPGESGVDTEKVGGVPVSSCPTCCGNTDIFALASGKRLQFAIENGT